MPTYAGSNIFKKSNMTQAPLNIYLHSLISLLVLFCVTSSNAYISTSMPRVGWSKDVVFRHDSTCFTQGLMYVNNSVVLETCGLYGQSTIHFYNIDTGTILFEQKFSDEIFAEGVCRVGDFVYVLTWKENCILRLEYDTLKVLGCIYWDSEGWGMTYDNNDTVFITDGSHYLTYVNATVLNEQTAVPLQVINRCQSRHMDETTNMNPDMQLNVMKNCFMDLETKQTNIPYVIKKLPIFCNNEEKPTNNLNELEYVNQTVYANVWQTRYVIRINAQTGTCDAVLNFQSGYTGAGNTMNGIAYSKNISSNKLLLTGKLWTEMIQVDLKSESVPLESNAILSPGVIPAALFTLLFLTFF